MIVTIRQGTPADLANVVTHYGPGDTPWYPFGDLVRLQGIPLEGLVIAEMDGEYAGFLYWFMGENPWFDTGTEKFAYINEIHVVKEYQRQGIGRKLLNYTLEQLKEKNIGPTYISTTERNIVARHLYEDAGFREFSRSIHYKLE